MLTGTDVRAKATIGLAEGTITFEGSESFVNAQVARFARQTSDPPDQDGSQKPEQILMSERELVSQKKPSGHPETVAVLAFALAQQGVTEFNEEQIRRAYIRSNIRPPKVVSQALRDAKNRFDFVEPASKKGHYKLSHHGDRTVRFDLPRRDNNK